MAKRKPESFFWTSYSDLMTSMFFVMLVLFVLTVALLQKKMIQTERAKEHLEALIAKGEQIEKSIEKIDSTYFDYNEIYKRHTLKNVKASFRAYSSDINDISENDRAALESAGRAIQKMLREAQKAIPDARYLVIIEGQSSKDTYTRNYELSYERALSLYKYLKENRALDLKRKNCEVLISGSGTQGTMRALPDNGSNKTNQRFLIHILPKPGVIQ